MCNVSNIDLPAYKIVHDSWDRSSWQLTAYVHLCHPRAVKIKKNGLNEH